MKSRSLLFWTISIATLMVCLFIPVTSSKNTTFEPLMVSSILKVEPKHLAYYDSKFHATFAGRLHMKIEVDQFNIDPLIYDIITVNELEMDYTTQISLHWKVDGQSLSQVLNHGPKSITPIDFQTSEPEKITDLQFILSTDFELNTQPSKLKTVTFKSISFDNHSNLNTLDSHLAQWFAFKPVEVNSINGMTNTDKLQYQSLIYRLVGWLLINVVLYLLIKVNGFHLVMVITVAWILTAIPLLSNSMKQHQQIVAAYPEEHEFINSRDKSIFELAQSIKSGINNLPTNPLQSDKYILLGSNEFESLRLFYHLTDLNIGMSPFSNKYNIDHQKQPIYILANKHLAACDDPKAYLPSQPFKLLLKKPLFCLVTLL